MKASKYNFFAVNAANERIAFNAISAALAKIDNEHYLEYKLIEEGKTNLSKLDKKRKLEVHKNLERGSFIYDDTTYNEDDVIAASYNINKYYAHHLSLTIAPTMSCNFDCFYCYEKKGGVNKSFMGEEIEKETVHFVDYLLKENSKLSISWYGGEPLLAKETIYRLSEKFLEICEKKKCAYHSSMVTNGFYLDKEVVDTLVKYKLAEVQITLDGPAAEHDKRRYDKKEGPSFDRIISNIKYAKDFIRVIIRTNLDKENIDRFDELVKFFQDNNLTENISIYPGRTCDAELDMGDRKDVLFKPDDYYEKEKKIMFNAIKENKKCLNQPYPNPSVIPCGAVNFNTFAVDPDGYVYKCWEVLGNKDEACFHISAPNLYSKKHLEWINWDPKDILECEECKHLPLCNGGCVLHAKQGKKTCSYWKNHLDDMLEILAYKYEKQRKEKMERTT